jgi:hypothetical protein
VSWLRDIAAADGLTLAEAAAYVVELGVVVSAEDWLNAGTEARAALVGAKHAARVAALNAEGRDIDAARAYATVDGGRTAARLLARAAGEGVARALRQEGKPGG